MRKLKTKLGWHFVQPDRRLRYNDNALVEPGYVYSVTGPTALCNWGLHASPTITHAARSFFDLPGYLCRVRCWGDLKGGAEKFVALNREVIYMVDLQGINYGSKAFSAVVRKADHWCNPWGHSYSNVASILRSTFSSYYNWKQQAHEEILAHLKSLPKWRP